MPSRAHGAFAGLALLVGCNAISGLSSYSKSTCTEEPCGGDDTGPGEDSGGVDATPPAVIDKVDVLFVVDNSLAMADKQATLAKSVTEFLSTLTASGGAGKAPTSVHVAFISSSLGSHGTSACAVALTNPSNDDKGHLLPRPGATASSGWVVSTPGVAPSAAPCPGFFAGSIGIAEPLTWSADSSGEPASFKGTAGAKTLQTAASCVVQSVGETGCGYEETLESMVHFLADPAPYLTAEVKCTFGTTGDACGSNKIVASGVDGDLLAQRAAFLRPDSVVAVVVLSDENDFSLRPAALNWLPWAYGAGAMQRGWAACESVSDDVEPDSSTELTGLGCFSCFQDDKNPNCTKPWAKDKLNADPDGRNLRGFHQVQRYGFNFLFGRDRYVKAFTSDTIAGSDGKLGPNGIFAGGQRVPSMVFLTTIVGAVPSLVADPTSPDWGALTGPSRDPHMIESIAPRGGVPKFAGARSVDAVNGGDRDVPDGDDLQYACIAPRASGAAGAADCADLGSTAATKNPLCDSSSKQSYFKAYPGLRFLRVAQSLGPQAIVGSVCAASYAPPLNALATKIRAALR